MSEFWDAILRHYQDGVIDSGKQPQFFILLAFILTFLVVRGITHAIRAGRGGRLFRNVSRGGTHIHHLVWGILLLLVTGYLAFAFDPTTAREPLAVLFGIGAALTLDEFALWLNLKDVYWAKEGRRSIDVVVITAMLLGLVVIGLRFWINVGREIGRLVSLD
jgi:hypothetical protein